MKAYKISFLILSVALLPYNTKADNGFRFEGPVKEVKVRYWTYKNLIILPTVINDSIKVNLILDTGTQNLILFGKRFHKEFQTVRDKTTKICGLGSRSPDAGLISLNNKVSLSNIFEKGITIILGNHRSSFFNIHGIIGRDLFLKFEIEIDPGSETIIFRPNQTSTPTDQTIIPLRFHNTKPVVTSTITINDHNSVQYDLMLDTGSSAGLLLKPSGIEDFNFISSRKNIGKGLSGFVFGYDVIVEKMTFENVEIKNLSANIIESSFDNTGSIGMEVLKEYVCVFNYSKSYVYLKRIRLKG